LLQLLSLTHAMNLSQGWRDILLKSSVILVPAALFCCDYITEVSREKLLKWYCLILFIACLIAFGVAVKNYLSTHVFSVFLYHSLVSVYSGHAIQFSILVFIVLLHLFEMSKKKQVLFNKYIHFFLIPFFLFFLVL